MGIDRHQLHLCSQHCQRTFVTEKFSRRLKLPVLHKIDLRLNTFAEDETTLSQKHNAVQLKLQSQFDQSECVLKAVEIPIICKDLSTILTHDAFIKHLTECGMNLANQLIFPSTGHQMGTSVLIGSD